MQLEVSGVTAGCPLIAGQEVKSSAPSVYILVSTFMASLPLIKVRLCALTAEWYSSGRVNRSFRYKKKCKMAECIFNISCSEVNCFVFPQGGGIWGQGVSEYTCFYQRQQRTPILGVVGRRRSI